MNKDLRPQGQADWMDFSEVRPGESIDRTEVKRACKAVTKTHMHA